MFQLLLSELINIGLSENEALICANRVDKSFLNYPSKSIKELALEIYQEEIEAWEALD